MSLRGSITKWMGDKAFGFVRIEGGNQDIFLHLTAIEGGGEPGVGRAVRFDVYTDEQTGKPRASNVRIEDGGGGMGMGGMGGLGGLQTMLGGSLQVQGRGGYGGGNYNQRGWDGGYNQGGKRGGQGPRDRDQPRQRYQQRKDQRKWQEEEKPMDEEKVLIDFGKLLAGGNAEAQKVHSQYENKKDMKEFLKAASKLLSKKGNGKKEKGDKPRDGPASGSKNEEAILISFGEKLNSGDEEAAELHKEHSEKKIDYAEFLKRAQAMVADKE